MYKEIRLSGFGGQGLILAGIILAEAVGIHEDKYVVQTQSYGPEARGGKSKAEVVISDNPIDYPKATYLDMLLAMSQDSCDSYSIDLKKTGILLVDSSFVKDIPTSKAIQIPFTKIAEKKTGKKITANIVALGAICYFLNIVSMDSMKKALSNRIPPGTKKMNYTALLEGFKAAKKIKI